jgi:hypothetical protein
MTLGVGTFLLAGAKLLHGAMKIGKVVAKGFGSGKGFLEGFGLSTKHGHGYLNRGMTRGSSGGGTGLPGVGGGSGGAGGGGSAMEGLFGKASPAKIASYGKAFAGLGVAAAGAGAGIGFAAFGIARLAESMKELSGTQIFGLTAVVLGIGGAMAGVLVPAIYALGAAGSVGAVGLLAIGAAALGIGAGIGIAAAGIGYLATGVGQLLESASKVNARDMLTIASAIGGIGFGLTTMGNPLAVLGSVNLMGVLSMLQGSNSRLGDTAGAVSNMITALKGSSDDLKMLESVLENISNMEVGDDSVISKLSELFNKPLKVEFAQKDVSIKLNVDLYMDKEKVARSLNLGKRVEIQQVEQKNGKGAAN